MYNNPKITVSGPLDFFIQPNDILTIEYDNSVMFQNSSSQKISVLGLGQSQNILTFYLIN
jgi:hypothetical protein